MRKLLIAAFGMLVAAGPAAAQDYKPVDVHFGFGWAFPSTNVKNDFDTGWNGALGVTYNINEHVGVMAEYMYLHMNGPSKNVLLSATPVAAALSSGVIESNHQLHIGSFNLVYKMQSQDRPFGGYVLGGGGIYHRIVQLTSPSTGYTTVCDPYWYVCYPGYVSVDTIIGDRSQNNFGMDFGGGFTIGREGKFYVETRYHYVWGSTVTPTTGVGQATGACANGCSTNASYFPLTFGFRW